MSTKKQPPQIGIRLPPDLRDYIEAQARTNFRSVSSEIAMRVERTRQLDSSRPQGAAQ